MSMPFVRPGPGEGALASRDPAALASGAPAYDRTKARPNVPGTNIGGTSAAIISQDPSGLYRQAMKAAGVISAPHGMFSKLRESRMGQALAAMVQGVINSGGSLDDINDIINQFNNSVSGGTYYRDMAANAGNYLTGAANLAGGGSDKAFFNSADPQQIDQFIKQMMGLQTMGKGAIVQTGAANQYEDLINQITDAAYANDMNESGNLGQTIADSDFFQRLAQMR